jgi:hypothetical protein
MIMAHVNPEIKLVTARKKWDVFNQLKSQIWIRKAMNQNLNRANQPSNLLGSWFDIWF